MPKTPLPKKKLAASNGPWLTKSEAKKRFKLAASDLDSILPVTSTRNPHGGPYDIQTFNLCDVEALAARLNKTDSSPQAGPSNAPELAEKNGKQILRTKALKEYKLKPEQLDRISPVKISPNPHKPSSQMRHYNLCDVEALAEEVKAAKAAPVGNLSKKRFPEDWQDDYNPFDGLSREDAADLFAKKTGIVDWAAYGLA